MIREQNLNSHEESLFIKYLMNGLQKGPCAEKGFKNFSFHLSYIVMHVNIIKEDLITQQSDKLGP